MTGEEEENGGVSPRPPHSWRRWHLISVQPQSWVPSRSDEGWARVPSPVEGSSENLRPAICLELLSFHLPQQTCDNQFGFESDVLESTPHFHPHHHFLAKCGGKQSLQEMVGNISSGFFVVRGLHFLPHWYKTYLQTSTLFYDNLSLRGRFSALL